MTGKFDNLREIEGLDPKRDCERMMHLSFGYEFCWNSTRALELALYRTYCVPSISALLDRSGEFYRHPQRRYDDTAILIAEICEWGYERGRGREALERINWAHSHFSISNDDFLFVLSTFIYEPIRWIDRYGWRPTCRCEKLGYYYFWRGVGTRMGIRNIPPTYEDFEAWARGYETRTFRYSDTNRKIGAATRDLFASWYPRPFAPLLEAGARAVDTPSGLARGADFMITCVTDGNAVEELVFGDNGIASTGSAGKVLIDMSTIAADHTRELCARLEQQCAMGWLDAPISGGAPAALEGRMAVMVGGNKVNYNRAQPVWDALAARATLMGDSGAGQTTKLINQVLVACGMAVLSEACGLAERAGVDPARIPIALQGGRADSRLLQEFMPKMAASDFAVTGRLDIMLKDLQMISDLARAQGSPMPVTSLVEELHRKLVLDGLGGKDNSEMVRLYRGA